MGTLNSYNLACFIFEINSSEANNSCLDTNVTQLYTDIKISRKHMIK